MSSKKSKTCKYNANRDSDYVYPFCTWNPNIIIPPHIFWQTNYLDESICKRCKAYEKA